MAKEAKTNFGWKLIIRIPENVPAATFIQGHDAEPFLEEYNGRVKRDFDNAEQLRVLTYDKENQLVRGSNDFAVVLANQMVRPQGMRTATQADIEQVIATEALPLYNQYEDTGLVIRSESGVNSYLAQNTMMQMRKRMPEAKFPLMIPLAGLNLVQDSNSEYGLAFKLRDDAQIYEVPILNEDGNFTAENINSETGLPTKVGKEGTRHLYKRNDGLSRLYLDRSLSVDSVSDNLASSNDNGRVVLVRGEAANAKIFEEYSAKQNANIQEIETRLRTNYEANQARIRQLAGELKLL